MVLAILSTDQNSPPAKALVDNQRQLANVMSLSEGLAL